MSEQPDELRASARRPRKVLWGAVLVLVGWLVVAGLGGSAQGKLTGVQSNDNSTFLPKSAESTLVANAVATFSESDTLPYLVVVQRTDEAALTPQDLQAVAAFAEGVPALALPELLRMLECKPIYARAPDARAPQLLAGAA
jgi:RND superfamily putative drug exporter